MNYAIQQFSLYQETWINKFQFQYTMKTSHRTQSTPNKFTRKFSTIQPQPTSNNPLFLTQKCQKPNSELEITERHQQLNSYIDELNTKIKLIVEHNGAEMLFAYRNHFSKVREQIQFFKQETLNEIKLETSIVQRMQKMQKQLIVFRSQALRLFELVLNKDKAIQELRMKVDEMESEKKYMDNRVKQLLKNIKDNKLKQLSIQSIDSQFQQKSNKLSKFQQFGKTFYSVGLHSYKKNKQFDKKMKDRTLTASNYRHTKTFEKEQIGIPVKTNLSTSQNDSDYKQMQSLELNSLIKEKFHYIESTVVEDIVKTTAEYFQINQNHPSLSHTKTVNCSQFQKTRYSLRTKPYTGRQWSKSKKQNFFSAKKNAQMQAAEEDCSRNELSIYFQKCVNVIKQEIANRTKRQTVNFLTQGKAISLQDFKKIDFLRLIEMVFSNDKVTQILFQAILGKNKQSVFSQF